MKLRTVALAGASLIAFATPAAAGTGWYLGLGAGWSELKDVETQRASPGGAAGGHIEFNTTVRGDYSVGFKTASRFRIELEDGYAQYKVKKATAAGTGAAIPGAGGSVSIGTMMANLAYDMPLTSQLGFTVGGGLGMGSVLANYSDPVENNRKSDRAFAYQAIAGVTWTVNPQLDLELGYHYVSVAQTTHDFASTFGVPKGKINYGEADSHNIMLNIRWFLQGHRRHRHRRLRRHHPHRRHRRRLHRHRRRLHRRRRRHGRRRRRRHRRRRLRFGPSSSSSTSISRT